MTWKFPKMPKMTEMPEIPEFDEFPATMTKEQGEKIIRLLEEIKTLLIRKAGSPPAAPPESEKEKAMTHDQKSYDLAEYFLPADATEARKSELANAIQRAVEDELTEAEKAAL